MMLRLNFMVLTLFCSFVMKAQSGFVKAYIVQLNGDTVRGEAKINPKKEQDNYNKVTFKDDKGFQKIYKPGKIKGYGFNNEHFTAIATDEETSFYNVLASGHINLYKFVYEGMRMNKSVFEAEYYLADKEHTKLVLVKENKFKKQLAEWMPDNPTLVEGFEESKQFDPAKASEIINQYNAWKASH